MHKQLNLGAFLLLSLTSGSAFTMHNESNYPAVSIGKTVTKDSVTLSRYRDYGHRSTLVTCTKNLETGETKCKKSYTIAGPLGDEWAGFIEVTKNMFKKIEKELNNSKD